MPILNIRDMGTVGVNSDIAPWELPPSALNAGINFRMSNGKIQSAGGVDLVGPTANDEIGHIVNTRSYAGESRWLVMGRDSIKLLDKGKWTNLSAGTGFLNLDESLWSSCQIGNVTFMNHPWVFPYYWIDAVKDDGSPVMDRVMPLPWHIEGDGTIITWGDVDKSCSVICAHKNFLFALGMKEFDQDVGPVGADVEYRDRVRWSHPVEPNGIPFSWKETAFQPDSIAGYVNLGRGGKVVGGESLRDSFIIYSEDAISALDFVGDALGWRRRSISANVNLVGKECVVEVKGQHFFLGRDDIMAFDGNGIQSIVHNRLRTRLAANVNNDKRSKSWAAHYESFNEVWFAVPSATADFPDLAYVYNYRDNTWGVRHLEQEFRHGAFGDEPSDLGNRVWDDMISSWDDDRGSWAMGGESPFAGALHGAHSTFMYDLDPGVSTYNESAVAYSPDQQGNWDAWVTDDEAVVNASIGIGWLGGRLADPYATLFAEVDVVPLSSLALDPVDKVDLELLVKVAIDPTATRRPYYGKVTAVVYWNGVEQGKWPMDIDPMLPMDRLQNQNITIRLNDRSAGEKGALRVEFVNPGSGLDFVRLEVADLTVFKQTVRTDTLISRSDLPIGGHEANTTITRLYPLIEGTSPVQIRVGSAQRAGGPVQWAGGFRTFTPGVDRKIDVRTTGETHAYEIKSSGRAFFNMTGMDIEYSPAGSR